MNAPRNTQIDSVLGAALQRLVTINEAELGNAHLYENADATLRMSTFHGFTVDAARPFEVVARNDGFACARAIRRRQPVFVDDVMMENTDTRLRRIAVEAGFRSAHSVPLLSTEGDAVGTLSIYFSEAGRSSRIDATTSRRIGRHTANVVARLLADTSTCRGIAAKSGSASARPPSPIRPLHLMRKLDRDHTLRESEKTALIDAISSIRCHGPHEEIVLKGEMTGACTVLLNGVALAYDVRLDGRRQVVAIHIPGDICDLSTFVLRQAHSNITTLTPCTVGIIPHTALRDLIERHPRIASMFWRETATMDAIRSAWISVLGNRSASERMCHLFCELVIRLQRLGLAEATAFHLPFTQPDLANILGISTVHVNRVLKTLRKERLVSVDRHGYVLVHSWQKLQNRAEFDPVYLKES